MEEAAALKERGNVCARSGKLQEAANLYSDAAGLAQAVSGSEAKKLAALCFSNKAQMLLQLVRSYSFYIVNSLPVRNNLLKLLILPARQ